MIYKQIKKYYDLGIYTKDDVKKFVPNFITAEQYEEITGEPYAA